MTKFRKTAVSLMALLTAATLASGTVIYAFKDDKDGTGENVSTTRINRLNTQLDTGIDSYFDSKVVTKLPSTVASQDDVSVIVAMGTKTVLQAYRESEFGGNVGDYVLTKEAKAVSAETETEAAKLIKKLDKSKIDYKLGTKYDTVLSGFEVTIKAKDFDRLNSLLDDDATLIVGETYNRCETQVITNDVDVYTTGIFDSSKSKYQGDGVVVAVLDTGLDYTHTAFSVDNFKTEQEAFTLQSVSSKVRETKAATRTANLTGSDVYVSRKVPYAYDYADSDPDVFPINSNHGTHVAGIIAGKDDTITGVAPNAQLAIMKVFSDTTDGARTSWILSALEDCVILGVDVINMSLGSSCGFSREEDKENINVVYDSIREAGISLIAAASNDSNATSGSDKNGSLGTTYNPDSGTVGSPSTYEGALSVASVDGVKTPYIMHGDDIIYFTEASASATLKKNFVDDVLNTLGPNVDSHEFEYVTISGVGRASDYLEPNSFYHDKIVLVKRGTTTFEDKVRVALNEKGAAGIIIYNNVSGSISMTIGKASGAVCSITQDEGEKLAASETGTLLISRQNTAGPFMSDFSSWGPTSDLRIKPEITAHGGEIYSAVPGQAYDRMSGTSMACPNQAGATALIRQYVKYSGVFGDLSSPDKSKEVTALVNQLMMSTADIVYNKNGLPYSVRKQGAGLVNITNSYTSASYITTYDKNGVAMGKSKIELGDDKNKTGVYRMTFDINNVSGSAASYEISSTMITEGISTTFTGHGDATVTQDGRLLDAPTKVISVSGGVGDGNLVTVSARSTAKVTVEITLSDADREYLESGRMKGKEFEKYFKYGMYVDGFINFTAKSGTEVDMHTPVLAFYGDWTEAPIFDEEYYDTNADELNDGLDVEDKLMADAYATRAIGNLYSDYISTLGAYYFIQDPAAPKISASKEHISLSNKEDGESSSVNGLRSISAGLLRNAKYIDIVITEDATGNVIFRKQVTNQHKSYTYGVTIYPTSFDIDFSVLENDLKNNTRYTVEIAAYIDYGSKEEQKNVRNKFIFPMFVDFEAPIVTDVSFRSEYDKTSKKTQLFADVSVYDNHYTMGMQLGQIVLSGNNDAPFSMKSFSKYVTPVYSSFNSTSMVSLELTDFINQIKTSSVGITETSDGYVMIKPNSNTFVLNVFDYAMNAATYEIELPAEVIAMAFNEAEIKLSPNETLDLSSPETGLLNIYPVNTWSQVLDYSSDNVDVADVINQTVLAKASGSANITVTGKNAEGKVQRAVLKVTVLAEGDEGYIGNYTIPQINKFELTGYTTNKAYYELEPADRDIGLTGNDYTFDDNNYTLKMYPSESVTLKYTLDSYFKSRTSISYSVGNENIAVVSDDGTIVAQAEGTTVVFLNVMFDGGPTLYSARVNISVKDPYATSSIYLNSYKGLGGEVIVPDDRGVTIIASFAFSNYDYVPKDPSMGDIIDEEDPYYIKQWFIGDETITKVVIPEGVEEIQSYAFANLTALKEVVLPTTLKKIGLGAFYGCRRLASINLEHVQFINARAFYNCNLTSVNLSNVVAIGDYSFEGCKLNALSLPVSAQSLGIGAFLNNKQLTSVQFAAPKMQIGSYAFSGCSMLMAVNINAAVISSYAFKDCGALTDVTLGRDVAVIGEYAFSGTGVSAYKLDSANPNFHLEENGGLVFEGNKLVLVAPAYGDETITTDATSIAAGAFAGNTKVWYVYAENATEIGAYAFAGCINLRRAYIPKVEVISAYAFYNTDLQETPNLSEIKSIGAYAFAGTSLTEVNIPDETVVAEYAFSRNVKLESVTIGERAVIGRNAFYASLDLRYTYENNSQERTLKEFASEFNQHYIKSNYVNEKGEAFVKLTYDYVSHASSVLESLVIGKGTVIGDSAFADSARLTSLTIGEDVVIGRSAFYNAFSLKEVDLSKVASIGANAFSGTITQNYDYNSITGDYSEAYDYVYRNGEWITEDYSYSSAAPGLTAVDLSGVKSLGDAAFMNNDELKSVKLGNGITAIPSNAFANTVLEAISLPASVTTVGDFAFYRTKLQSVDLSNVTSVGAYAFAYTAMTDVTLNSEGSEIGGAAFAFNENLGEVVNLDKVTVIGYYAFYHTSLETLKLTNAQRIGSFAFAHTPVKSVELGNALVLLGDNPFSDSEITTFAITEQKKFGQTVIGTEIIGTYDISDTVKVIDGVLYQKVPNGLELICYPTLMDCDRFTIQDGTVRVAAEAFAYSQLRSVIIPASVKSLGDKAFYGCKELAMVVFQSYEAPMLEEAYDPNYVNPDNSPTSADKNITDFYMWNGYSDSTNYYFGATFVGYIGDNDCNVVMVKPSNGTGYNTFIFSHYFGNVIDGSAAAMNETLEVIRLIAALPAATEITLADKDKIVAVRSAYDKLPSLEQQALVDISRLTAAESTIFYLENTTTPPTVTPEEPPIDNGGNGSELTTVLTICFAVVIVALVAYIVISHVLKLKNSRVDKFDAEESNNGEDENNAESADNAEDENNTEDVDNGESENNAEEDNDADNGESENNGENGEE